MHKRRTVGVATFKSKVVLHSPVRLYSGGFSVSSLELVEAGYVVVVLHLVLRVASVPYVLVRFVSCLSRFPWLAFNFT